MTASAPRPANLPRVLQLAPRSFFHDPHLGSSKDIAGRIQYYEDRGIAYKLLEHGRRAEEVLAAVDAVRDRSFSQVVVEKGATGAVLRRLRHRLPETRILVRGHNAEILHRIDYVRAQIALRGLMSREVRKALNGIWFFGGRDLAAARYAHAILSIARWDAEHYWRRLVGSSRTASVPYFLSRRDIREIKQTRRKRKAPLCVIPGSTAPGPLVEHSLLALHDLLGTEPVRSLRAEGWTFVISGKKLKGSRWLPIFEDLGVGWRRFATPYECFNRARAVLLPSPLGRGFKTKLLEAIVCRAFVICPHELQRRLPVEIEPYCQAVDMADPVAVRGALEATDAEFPGGNPNRRLQKLAYAEMDRVFGVSP